MTHKSGTRQSTIRISQNASTPWTLGQWCALNLSIAISSFGGGNRLLLYRESVVSRGLHDEVFDQIVACSQIMPGPNLVNAVSLLGIQILGWQGCILGLLSLVLPSTMIALVAMNCLSCGNELVLKLMQGAALSAAGIVLAETIGFGNRTFANIRKHLINMDKIRTMPAVALVSMTLSVAPFCYRCPNALPATLATRSHQ